MELLRKAAPVMGIKKTALDVLEKLLSFHPDGIIDPMSGNTIVFPSNETLRERLNGLSERTLRRAIGDLVEADLVCRCDSPNRKRYRRVLAGKVIAYGFDVAPLRVASPNLKGLPKLPQANASGWSCSRSTCRL